MHNRERPNPALKYRVCGLKKFITWSGSLEYRRAEPGSSLSDNPRKGVAPPDVHAFDPHFLTHGSYSATTRGSHFFGFAGSAIHHRPKGLPSSAA